MATKKKTTKKTAKKKVTKKRTTRKKKITEASYEVGLSRDVAGAPQQTKKTVSAPNPEQAIDKAKLGDPNVYDEIAVKKMGGPGGPASAQPQVTPQGAPNTLENKGKKKRAKKDPVKSYKLTSSYTAEAFPFPYNIALPRIFEPITEKMVEGTSLKVKDRYALIEVTITDAVNMDKVVENLVKRARGRNKQLKTMAESVIKGMMYGKTK